jgi:hypothetical protein
MKKTAADRSPRLPHLGEAVNKRYVMGARRRQARPSSPTVPMAANTNVDGYGTGANVT